MSKAPQAEADPGLAARTALPRHVPLDGPQRTDLYDPDPLSTTRERWRSPGINQVNAAWSAAILQGSIQSRPLRWSGPSGSRRAGGWVRGAPMAGGAVARSDGTSQHRATGGKDAAMTYPGGSQTLPGSDVAPLVNGGVVPPP